MDINGKPKFFRKSIYQEIQPIYSKEWFIDTEILIKLRKNGKNIIEIPGEFEKRQSGKSNVKFFTALGLLKELLVAKFGGLK